MGALFCTLGYSSLYLPSKGVERDTRGQLRQRLNTLSWPSRHFAYVPIPPGCSDPPLLMVPFFIRSFSSFYQVTTTRTTLIRLLLQQLHEQQIIFPNIIRLQVIFHPHMILCSIKSYILFIHSFHSLEKK